jgi:hypothetical protein
VARPRHRERSAALSADGATLPRHLVTTFADEAPGCSTMIRVDLLRSVGTAGAPATWDVAYLGADLPSGLSCVVH